MILGFRIMILGSRLNHGRYDIESKMHISKYKVKVLSGRNTKLINNRDASIHLLLNVSFNNKCVLAVLNNPHKLTKLIIILALHPEINHMTSQIHIFFTLSSYREWTTWVYTIYRYVKIRLNVPSTSISSRDTQDSPYVS